MSVLAVAHRVLVRVEALLERRSGEASISSCLSELFTTEDRACAR